MGAQYQNIKINLFSFIFLCRRLTEGVDTQYKQIIFAPPWCSRQICSSLWAFIKCPAIVQILTKCYISDAVLHCDVMIESVPLDVGSLTACRHCGAVIQAAPGIRKTFPQACWYGTEEQDLVTQSCVMTGCLFLFSNS